MDATSSTTRAARMQAAWVALAITGLLAVLAPAPAEAATATDFAGRWEAIDDLDGSNLDLRITRSLRVKLKDDAATICNGVPAVVTGQGVIVGDTLVIEEFHVRCRGEEPDHVVRYELTPVGGQLVDNLAQAYDRA